MYVYERWVEYKCLYKIFSKGRDEKRRGMVYIGTQRRKDVVMWTWSRQSVEEKPG